MLDPTPEQERVLSAPLGPMRIAAGAGTGKTTTVAMLVHHLTTAGGVEPEAVLGITFTNKAAGELADRIRGLLSADLGPGREAEVHTYHGFAAQVVSEFGALVGIERGASVITPTFARQLLFEVVRHRDFHHLDVTWDGSIEKVQRLGAALGDHLVDAQSFTRAATGEEPWPERLELLATWQDYQEEKRRLGVVDYADLISSAVRLLAEHPDIRERIRDRYRVVLLDEYQDTNPAQRVMLQYLFGDGFPVVAVGDTDQTIYEWRGATPANFEAFPSQFPKADGSPAQRHELTLNRRSDRLILDVANLIRARIRPHAPRLQARKGAGPGKVGVRWAGDALAEADWIADQVVRLHESGVPWSEIAILFRKNRHIALIHDALGLRDVPVEVANLGGLLSVPQVADIRAWMSILHAPEDGPSLLRIVMGPRFGLGIGDLAHLTRWVVTRGDPNRELEADHERLPGHTMVEALDHLEQIQDLPDRVRKTLTRFRAEYRRLLEAAQSVSLGELTRLILDVTGTWRDVEALSPAGRLSARLNLYRFLDLTDEWSPLEGRPSLAAFLHHLDVMESNPADELDAARLSGEEAVALLTIHRAKGLEWDVVFVPSVTKGNFPAKPGTFENPYTRPQWLPHAFRLDDPPDFDAETCPKDAEDLLRQRHLRQEWRTAYVAVTRARHRLLLSGASWYGAVTPTQNPVDPSPLLDLVAGVEGVEDLGRDPLPPRPEVLRLEGSTPAPDPLFPHGWPAALREAISDPGAALERARSAGLERQVSARLGEFQQRLFELEEEPEAPSAPSVAPSTSVTGLVTYAACPRRYYWSQVDRLPRRPNPAARRGVDVHRRIELHAMGQVPLEDAGQAGFDLVEGESVPSGVGSAFSAYLGSAYARRKPVLVEVPFQFITPPGLAVRGRIDAIYADDVGEAWEIVDFKSGRPRSDPWLPVQLEAYALATQQVDFGHPLPSRVSVSFVYLGNGLQVRTRDADASWLTSARTHIEGLAGAIVEGVFDPEPSSACRSCEFSRFCPPGSAWLTEHPE